MLNLILTEMPNLNPSKNHVIIYLIIFIEKLKDEGLTCYKQRKSVPNKSRVDDRIS